MLDLRLAAWQRFEEMPWPKADRRSLAAHPFDGFNLDKFAPFALPDAGKAGASAALIQHELDEMESAASIVFQDGDVIYRDESENLAARE